MPAPAEKVAQVLQHNHDPSLIARAAAATQTSSKLDRCVPPAPERLGRQRGLHTSGEFGLQIPQTAEELGGGVRGAAGGRGVASAKGEDAQIVARGRGTGIVAQPLAKIESSGEPGTGGGAGAGGGIDLADPLQDIGGAGHLPGRQAKV